MSFSVGPRRSQQIQAPGAFQNAHDCVFNNPQFVSTMTDDGFMEKLAGFTIQGAELDSSARDPPPRCHPDTRRGIVDRTRRWFCDPCRTKRMLWLVGPAGVGKSAIVQTVAEVECEKCISAALFFSAPNGRNDASKVISTLAYQLAAQYPPYLHYIRTNILADPKVLEKSIKRQFSDFIVKPFVTRQLYQGARPILMFIDGLDECDGHDEQILILGLISFFTMKYPNSPLLWVISSRPEDHITRFLARRRFASCFDKEEISVDSTEACRDVERFLRSEFAKIRSSNSVMSLYPNWPPESLLLDLFAAALGHFAYADTAIRFIREGNHVTRFQLIINLIERPTSHQSNAGTTRPMARLDTLYRYIIEQIAPDDLPHTNRILSYLLFPLLKEAELPHISFVCDWLGMTPDVIYSALRELHSVLEIPPPDKPFGRIKFHHKSFADSLLRMQIPGFPVDRCDAEKGHKSQLMRVLNRIPTHHSPIASTIPQFSYSWTYRDPVEFERAEDTFSYRLFGFIRESGILFDQHVSAGIIHTLKMATVSPKFTGGNHYSFLTEIFDDSSILASHLRADGSLRDIPIGLLDKDATQDHYIVSSFSNVHHKYDSERRCIPCIENAILNSPNVLVKAFILNRLQGWIDVTTILLADEDVDWGDLGVNRHLLQNSDMSRVLLRYNFSTIYETIMSGGPSR